MSLESPDYGQWSIFFLENPFCPISSYDIMETVYATEIEKSHDVIAFMQHHREDFLQIIESEI